MKAIMSSCCLLLLMAGSINAQTTASASFKGVGDLVDTVQVATSFSPDKQAVTALWSNLQAGVGGGTKTPMVSTRTITLNLPIDSKDKYVQIRQIVRGYVSVQGNARAVLLIQAAGKTHLVDLKKSSDTAEPTGSLKQARENAKVLKKVRKQTDTDHDYMQQINGTVKQGTNYQVTFILLVEREEDSASALFTVDSFDVEIVKGSKDNK
jgi:hypothetical protein